jgi:L,D-transpeptidase ErfK/SrfK
VPKAIPDGIVVNIPDRMLYFFREGKLAKAFPVGLGLPAKEWQTPIGPFVIVRKERNPTWVVPKSIQREMERKGQPIQTIVPPGPDNPLGEHALHTSLPGVLIHGTIWPTTVYQWRSHGCIRVSAEHMEGFFDEIEKGAAGEIIYQPVSIAMREGNILLQVSRDVYGKIPSMDEEVKARIEERGLADKVDWVKVGKAIKEKTGIAEDVTR